MPAKPVVIFGLGRSGLSVAKALLRRGETPIVVDEKPLDALAKPEAAIEADKLGIEVFGGWDAPLASLNPSYVVANPAIPVRHKRLLEARASDLEILSEVEFAYRITKAPIVAITGTNGKSTTTVMTYLALRACGVDAVLCGNIFGSGYPEQPLTEAASFSTEDQVLVAEISSFQLEWVSQFRPGAAGITMIDEDHLDRYADFAEYASTKQRIFAAQTPDEVAVIRKGDQAVFPDQTRRPELWTFGTAPATSEISEESIRVLGYEIRRDTLPFHEPHNIANAAMATLLSLAALRQREPDAYLNYLPNIEAGLKKFKGLSHRMELVGTKDGIRVINNSMCTNPDAVVASTRAVNAPAHLLIGGVNKGADFTPLGEFLSAGHHQAYVFGRDANALNQAMGGRGPVTETMAEAFEMATAQAKAGEVIMLAPGCASTDQFRDFRHRGDVFKKLALAWLEGATRP